MSETLRSARRADESAAMYRRYFTKPSKCYPIGKNKISCAKHTGGALADLLDQMSVEPAFAQPVAARIQAHADLTTLTMRLCLRAASRKEQMHDSAEEVTQQVVDQEPENADAIRAHIVALDEAIASAREYRLALQQQLDELEAGK
jgi:hypothetical protein